MDAKLVCQNVAATLINIIYLCDEMKFKDGMVWESINRIVPEITSLVVQQQI
jgi:hypothetical protein